MTNTFKGPSTGQSNFKPNVNGPAPANRLLSPTIHSVINKRTNAVTKFSNRVPGPGTFSPCTSPSPILQRSIGAPNPTMPTAQYRYETPTTSTLAKRMPAPTGHLNKSQPNHNRQGGTTGNTRRRGGSVYGQDMAGVGGNHGSRRRSDSTGPASPPPLSPTIHKPSGTSVTSSKRNFVNNAAGRETNSQSQQSQQISKQPSEDFSAFQSYFSNSEAANLVGSSRVLAFPTS